MHGDACANRRGSGLGRRVYRDKSKAVEMRAQTFAIGKSHPSAEAATRGAIRLFGLQTLAAPQVFYCESPSQIERAGGLKLPFGTRSAASQHGGPVSPFELVTAQLRHDVLRRDHACARSAWGCGLVLEADGGDTRPARNRACG